MEWKSDTDTCERVGGSGGRTTMNDLKVGEKFLQSRKLSQLAIKGARPKRSHSGRYYVIRLIMLGVIR